MVTRDSSGYPAAAEIADQDDVAEFAEVTRGPHDAPGSIEPIAVLEATLEFALGAENVDEAEALSRYIVMAIGILLGVGDEEAATDVLYVEGRVIARNALVIEGIFAQTDAVEIGVVDFDACGAEVGGVEESLTVDFPGGQTFVDGAVR